ncbi:MAG: hypothetical protein VX672_01375 [Planctomycetota bacterium]|nr:hypothetical protein [Planctomycetota bacterium]
MNPGAGGAAVAWGETIGGVMLVIGILVGLCLGGLWAWLHARVIVSIPEADRRVRPRRFWVLFTATVLASIGLAVSRQQVALPEDAILKVSPWTIGLELVASVLWVVLVWYVCLGIPRGLEAAHSDPNSGIGGPDHGRKVGVALGVITTITVVVSLSSSTYIWSIGGVQPQSGTLIGLGCGSTLLGIAWLVLTIVFLVLVHGPGRRPAVVDPLLAERTAPPRRLEDMIGGSEPRSKE